MGGLSTQHPTPYTTPPPCRLGYEHAERVAEEYAGRPVGLVAASDVAFLALVPIGAQLVLVGQEKGRDRGGRYNTKGRHRDVTTPYGFVARRGMPGSINSINDI